ncbi:Uncharacterised protein [Escherichia coli]|nr:Uncharacterised protein [Escherichia coli]
MFYTYRISKVVGKTLHSEYMIFYHRNPFFQIDLLVYLDIH